MDDRSIKRLAIMVGIAILLILVFKSVGLKMATRVGQEHQKAQAARGANTAPPPPAPEPRPPEPTPQDAAPPAFAPDAAVSAPDAGAPLVPSPSDASAGQAPAPTGGY